MGAVVRAGDWPEQQGGGSMLLVIKALLVMRRSIVLVYRSYRAFQRSRRNQRITRK